MAFEENFFHEHVPAQLQIAMARCVLKGCAEARDAAKVYPKEWQKEATYTNRRLHVEPKLFQLVLPPGFEAVAKSTNSTTYTEISSEHVVITAVTRNRRVLSVPARDYRETLADEAVGWLFAQERNQPAPGKRLYALLVYGGPLRADRAEQCDIVFPLPTGKFGPGEIDLLARHEAALFPKAGTDTKKSQPRLRVVKKDGEA